MNGRVLLYIVMALVLAWYAYKHTLPKGKVAKSGEKTIYNSYENVSGMKHDFFKLFHQTFFMFFLLSPEMPIYSTDIFSSALGKSLVAASIIMTYHSTIQPYVNMLPAW